MHQQGTVNSNSFPLLF